MSGSEYYVQAIERALALMRQGANREAKNLLQDAIDLKLDMLPQDMLGGELELAFDPHADAATAPRCWIEGGELRIDEEGWEIDPDQLEELTRIVETNSVLGMSAGDIERNATLFLKNGCDRGTVRRK